MLLLLFKKTVSFQFYRFPGIGWRMIPNPYISEKTANWHFQRMRKIGMIPALPYRIYTVVITRTHFGLGRTYQLIEVQD
jgi:hypothetical protein